MMSERVEMLRFLVMYYDCVICRLLREVYKLKSLLLKNNSVIMDMLSYNRLLARLFLKHFWIIARSVNHIGIILIIRMMFNNMLSVLLYKYYNYLSNL